ncbi:hypothetical protein RR42_s3379 [Cupriavidus basilensis]|uniref:Uncharacterized protein n=1 Tax=Cupriavidus basilensis TaxID=68895 RepID=A0A0C4YR52_9BURK|nr:hypothetical protein RR42_s3379 [Cupriavidus basilensis]
MMVATTLLGDFREAPLPKGRLIGSFENGTDAFGFRRK